MRKYYIGIVSVVFILLLAVTLTSCSNQQNEWQEQYDLGMKYLSEGNYEEAIVAFTAAIEIDDKQAPVYVGRGDAYIGLGENPDNLFAAQADYEQAIVLDETNPGGYLGIADVYIRQDKYDKALEILRRGEGLATNLEQIEQKIEEVHNLIEQEKLAQTAFESPLLPNKIFSNGIPIQNCTSDTNPAALFVNNRMYIVDDTLSAGRLTHGMSKKAALKMLGLSKSGISYCEKNQFVHAIFENKQCTIFQAMEFSNPVFDECIVIEYNQDGKMIDLLVGFISGTVSNIESSVPIKKI